MQVASSASTFDGLRPPSNLGEFVGNPLAVAKIKQWQFRYGPLAISGYHGVGKSSLARLALGTQGRSVVSFDASVDVRPKEIEEIVRTAASRRPLDGSQMSGVVFEDLESGYIKEGELSKILKNNPNCPFVVVARDFSCSPALRRISQMACAHVHLSPATERDTQSLLIHVCRLLKIKLTAPQVLHIHNTSCGDLRKATLLAQVESRGEQAVTSGVDAAHVKGTATDVFILDKILNGSNIMPAKGNNNKSINYMERGFSPADFLRTDPVRIMAQLFDVGLGVATRHETPSSVESWSSILETWSECDQLARTGGYEETQDMVTLALTVNQQALSSVKPGCVRVTSKMATTPPSMFLQGKAASDRQRFMSLLTRMQFGVCGFGELSYFTTLMSNHVDLLQERAIVASLSQMDIDFIGKVCSIDRHQISKLKKALEKQIDIGSSKRRKK